MARTKAKRKSTELDDADVSYPSKRIRATDTYAAEGPRPSRRRKAAEVSLAKLKAINDDDDAFDEDEEDDESADEQASVEEFAEDKAEAQDLFDPTGLPVVAPGFRLWETNSALMARGGETQKVTKIGKYEREFSSVLDVKYSEAFKLVPLVITQGPYQGRHVFMLEPKTGGFPFMDLPAELRTLIYSFVVEAEGTIKVSTAKEPTQMRRPVRSASTRLRTQRHYLWNRTRRTQIDGNQGVTTLLSLSKQIFKEAAPVLYSDNQFSFEDSRDLNVWLDTIGSMRSFVRHIHLGEGGWHTNIARSVITKLKDATDLRSFSIYHANMCATNNERWITWRTSIELFGCHFSGVLRRLKENGRSAADLLDVVKVKWTRCRKCNLLAPEFPEAYDYCEGSSAIHYWRPPCQTKCKGAAEHCLEVEARLRKVLARELWIKDLRAELNGGDEMDDSSKLEATEVV